MFCGTEQEANLLSQIVLFCFFLYRSIWEVFLGNVKKGQAIKKNTQQVTR